MDDAELLREVRRLREIVARTQPPAQNRFWPVTLSWGCIITFGYLACGALGMAGRISTVPWVWPVLIGFVALPAHWYLARRVRAAAAERGIRPRFRKDLTLCWSGIAAIGLLWTAALAASGAIAAHWYLLCFVWGSLYSVGYVVNGVLVSDEWLWAAAVLVASLIAAFLAGPAFYWLPGLWIGGTLVLAGLLGRRNSRRRTAEA